MAMHEVTSLALERLLPRAYRRSGVYIHAHYDRLVRNSHHIDQLAPCKHSTLHRRVCVSGHRR